MRDVLSEKRILFAISKASGFLKEHSFNSSFIFFLDLICEGSNDFIFK